MLDGPQQNLMHGPLHCKREWNIVVHHQAHSTIGLIIEDIHVILERRIQDIMR